MKTERETRLEFSHYFLDLKASMAKDGAGVGKFEEWEGFIQHMIEEATFP